jgi:acyl-CoA reductase-like NAD-dependent aldehyde dehydrogenase
MLRKKHDKIGDQFSEGIYQGAQISDIQQQRILSFIEAGKKDGARLLYGGTRHGQKGYFIKPTIFADVRPIKHWPHLVDN